MFDNPRCALIHWLQKVRGKGHVYVLVPMLIMWAIWEARNNAKFEGVRMHHERTYGRTMHMVTLLGKASLLQAKNSSNANSLIGV